MLCWKTISGWRCIKWIKGIKIKQTANSVPTMHGIILCMSPHKAGNELWKFTCVGEHLSILFVGVYG
ncbi:hypothetical protein P5673_017004 [Acropora cervicornis]|uniref:Uncharacterized protein n=1 Tax=Acropora cervicornis TaxID=6130 RepID=A0AAD9QF13_ACRCE|nr:hypothetical protein P5673_017004 [Acropora cervicornis]